MNCVRAPWLLIALFVSVAQTVAAETLHQTIDRMIVAELKGVPPGPMADDAAFLRRVYLDLIGRIPSRQELATFVDSQDADKRSKLIETLLSTKDHSRRMRDLFNAMLMERRGENPEWMRFLQESFEANKPWDQLVREILAPDPRNEATRGAAYFHTRRLEKVGQQETDFPGLTRDVGRLFLGKDLQCAQCHNHLFIEDYKQQDFQGLFIVFQNTFIRDDVSFPAVGEKVIEKKLEFLSVFDKVPMAVGPRVPGLAEMTIPTFQKGEEFLVPPDRKTRFPGVPRFSGLDAVSKELPTPQNPAFSSNIVNRLWFVMTGQGLVNPLDQQHAHNPATHPDLLKLLSEEFVNHRYDIRWFVRELALTETYARTSVVPLGQEPPLPTTYAIANEKRLSAEQLMASIQTAAGERIRSLDADDKPGTEMDKLRAAFIKAFGNAPQDPEIEFAPSLKSALFMMNDLLVLDVLKPKDGNLVDRLLKIEDLAALADEMYQSILNRNPNDEERAFVVEHLMANKESQPRAVMNLAWGLLACTEFCLNH